MIVIGCFEVTPLAPGEDCRKWEVRNTLTGFTHRTYGTEKEVRATLETQSSQWKVRLGPKIPGAKPQRGSAWRNNILPKKKPDNDL